MCSGWDSNSEPTALIANARPNELFTGHTSQHNIHSGPVNSVGKV